MLEIKELQNVLKKIEDDKEIKNISHFKFLMNDCIVADTFISILWAEGQIGDNERYHLRARVCLAREKIIKTHKEFMLKTLNTYNVEDIETLVNVIYETIF